MSPPLSVLENSRPPGDLCACSALTTLEQQQQQQKQQKRSCWALRHQMSLAPPKFTLRCARKTPSPYFLLQHLPAYWLGCEGRGSWMRQLVRQVPAAWGVRGCCASPRSAAVSDALGAGPPAAACAALAAAWG
ncbi:unnamed protein product [Lampetra planeri]